MERRGLSVWGQLVIQPISRFPKVTKCYPMVTQGLPKGYPRVTQGLPKGYLRLPKVAPGYSGLHVVPWDCRHFNELTCSSKSRNALPWHLKQFHDLACSPTSLHLVTEAFMQFHEHECSSMGMKVLMFGLFVIKLKLKGCLRFYNVPEGYPRFPKVSQGTQMLQGITWILMKLHKLKFSKKRLHEDPWACMQLNKLACSCISLHAVTLACMQLH